MARDGQRIFDSDTHVGPSMDVLEQYMSTTSLETLHHYDEYRRVNETNGQVSYNVAGRSYRRRLGEVDETMGTGYLSGFTGAHKGRDPNPNVDRDPAARMADLDIENVDVNLLLPSGWFGSFTALPDLTLELAAYEAYNRWMKDYCGAFPHRLGGVILASARSVSASVREIERCAAEPWAWGLFPYVPYGTPLDHPDLEPLWAAAEAYDLAVILHTFTVMPPYAPGGLDTWDNLWIQRSAAHPWCGMRNMAALIGSGAMDRYPNMRIGVLESGHGWLPHWVARLDEHAKSVRGALPDLKMLPSEYVRSGRYFQSVEVSEGSALTQAVMDLLGEDILMFASDYPHSESWFPKTVDELWDWKLDARRLSKLSWENALNLYQRARLQV